jgi:hypothetical protein
MERLDLNVAIPLTLVNPAGLLSRPAAAQEASRPYACNCRGKPALNAFAITFADRMPTGCRPDGRARGQAPTPAVDPAAPAGATPWTGAALGSLALAVGMHTGCLCSSGVRALTAVVPAEHRAAVMSAFYLVAYAATSLPATGAVAGYIGVRPTFELFGGAAAAVAVVVAFQAVRARPSAVRPAPRLAALRPALQPVEES